MGLRLALLGGFNARTDDGAALSFATRKAEALLAVLAAKPGVAYPRERLTALLWPNSGEPQARMSLRQALNQVRKATASAGVTGIEAAGDKLVLNPAGVDVDTVRFEATASGSRESLERAAELYRGEFLDGFSLNEEPFEDWKRAESTRLRDRASSILLALLDHRVAVADLGNAQRYAEQLLRIDPACEAAYRALMQLYLSLDERAEAIRLYECCRDTLRRELGIEPGPEMRAVQPRASALGPGRRRR